MAPKNDGAAKKVMNKGAWTSEEDRKLSEYIEIHGAKRWKTVAAKSGYISYMFLPNISTEGEKWKKKNSTQYTKYRRRKAKPSTLTTFCEVGACILGMAFLFNQRPNGFSCFHRIKSMREELQIEMVELLEAQHQEGQYI